MDEGKAKSALVTGGGGFLGREIVRQLVEAGWDTRSFSRGRYEELAARGTECLVGDIRDLEAVRRAVKGCDLVVHTAAMAGIWGPWRQYYEINAVGSQNVLAACQAENVGGLVYTSSPSVTFDAADQCGVDETKAKYPRRWLSHYPRTKALAEQSILSADRPGGLRTCALRPHLIWGRGDPHLIPRVADKARRGRLRQIGAGANLVDTIHVRNAAWAHLLAAQSLRGHAPAGGKAYFISQDSPVNCWDWIREIVRCAGAPALPARAVPFRAAWRVGAALEVAYRVLGQRGEPPMTRFLAAQLAKSHYFDISAAKRDLNYRPLVNQEDGMAEVREWLAEVGRG